VNSDLGELLREAIDRATAGERLHPSLATRARQRHHRRTLIVRAAAVTGTVAVAAAAVFAATIGAGGAPQPAGGSAAQARTVAYVTSRVERALASQHLVFASRTREHLGGSTITWATWAYGSRGRTVEFTHGGSKIYLATGSALVGGKLKSAYVTYYNREFSLQPWLPTAVRPCSTAAGWQTGGPAIPVSNWRAFLGASLRCGAATVTGHVRIGGVETTKITGKPVTIRLPAGEAKSLGEKSLTGQWTLYVNPRTYLPVRMESSTRTFGGRWPSSTDSSVTDVQWLPPTRVNIAKAQVAIPAGFHRVSSPADQ
jgi:hypothetical protein